MKIKISSEDFNKDLDEYIDQGENLLQYTNYKELTRDDDSWLSNTSQFLKTVIESNQTNEDFNNAGRGMFIMGYDDELNDHKFVLSKKLDVLKSLKKNSKYFEFQDSSRLVTKHQKVSNNKVFIVHGRNDHYKEALARLIQKLGLDPIILHEQPNGGRTIIEKFERNTDVGFAVILATADDEGTLRGEKNYKPRARQNVILELGYFIGKLGRERVCMLSEKDIEVPSDIFGVVYEELDKGELWKFKLAKELKLAGYAIDLNNTL